MKDKSQLLLEQVYESMYKTQYLKEDIGEDIVNKAKEYATSLFMSFLGKSFPELFQAIEQASKVVESNPQEAGNIIANVIPPPNAQTTPNKDNKGVVTTTQQESTQQAIEEGVADYINAAKGLWSAIKDGTVLNLIKDYWKSLQQARTALGAIGALRYALWLFSMHAVEIAANSDKKVRTGGAAMDDTIAHMTGMGGTKYLKGIARSIIIFETLKYGLKEYLRRHQDKMTPEQKKETEEGIKAFELSATNSPDDPDLLSLRGVNNKVQDIVKYVTTPGSESEDQPKRAFGFAGGVY